MTLLLARMGVLAQSTGADPGAPGAPVAARPGWMGFGTDIHGLATMRESDLGTGDPVQIGDPVGWAAELIADAGPDTSPRPGWMLQGPDPYNVTTMRAASDGSGTPVAILDPVGWAADVTAVTEH